MAGLLRNITSLQDLEQRTAEAVDSNFLLYGALFIFLMQAGFGMLEVGAGRGRAHGSVPREKRAPPPAPPSSN